MTLDEAKVAAECWMRRPMLIPLEQQLEILRIHSDAARRRLLAILSDDVMWTRICALGDERLKASAERYGDRSFHSQPDALLWECMEELADARAYLAIATEREAGR